MHKVTKLDNGLRIVTDTVDHVGSVAGGFWCNTGARYEDETNNGIAHFFEHMIFQGTEKRSSVQIKEDMEDMGASINAYTSYDITSYHYHLLKDDIDHGFDVFADMIINSTFPEKELENERGAILQEIAMYEDTPDAHVDDLAQETAYADQALGRPILGPRENVKKFTRADLHDYQNNLMNPSNIVVSLAGNIQHDHAVAMAEKYFGHLPSAKENTCEKAHYTGGDDVVNRDIEQAQIMLQFEGLSRHEKGYYAQQLFSSLFGGGMSSRLFQEVREKRGLVYTVQSFARAYADTGTFTIYAGTDPEKANEAMHVCLSELAKAAHNVTERELERAKAQVRARLVFAQEKIMSRADRAARRMLFFNDLPNNQKILDRIEALTIKDVEAAAQNLLQSKLSRTILGRTKSIEDYDKTASHIAA